MSNAKACAARHDRWDWVVAAPRLLVPHLIDDNSGVGTQVMAVDVNGDKKLDIVVGNKRGAFVHVQK